MKRCRTCGIHLWLSYLIMGLPFQTRVAPYDIAKNCTDLMTYKKSMQLYAEARQEVQEKFGQALKG